MKSSSTPQRPDPLDALRSAAVQQAIKSDDFSMLTPAQLIAIATCCIPEMSYDSAKGTAGRLAVVGGSLEYTGAPYLAASAMLRGGADLAHVFCEQSAGTGLLLLIYYYCYLE
jgi:NAD(P)H-hydrate repair Nnr-like enzyme with NAD(P)H-hydrate dehydratase domain